jgi:hypothetical protein
MGIIKQNEAIIITAEDKREGEGYTNGIREEKRGNAMMGRKASVGGGGGGYVFKR